MITHPKPSGELRYISNHVCGNCNSSVFYKDIFCRVCGCVLDWRTCKTCKHFIGGGDFDLCCTQIYELCYEDTPACDKYLKIRTERS